MRIEDVPEPTLLKRIPDEALSSDPADVKRHTGSMLEMLQQRYPLPEGTVVKVEFSRYKRIRSVRKGGRYASATASICKEEKQVILRFHLANNFVLSHVSIVGHEYYHALQVMNMGIKIGFDGYHVTETDADTFGRRERIHYLNTCMSL